MSPFANAVLGEFPKPLEMNDKGIYPGWDGVQKAGLPITTGTNLSTESLEWPVATKSVYTAIDKSHAKDYTTARPSNAKRTASAQHQTGDSASDLTTPILSAVAFDASKPASVIPAGPGRRQLTRA